MPAAPVSNAFAHQELSAFLRSRRARLNPLDVGLAPGTRRRTPGLRREEVAQLAGVGITWYTWFEQGRDIRVSAHFLENLARALRFNPAERAHLFALAHGRMPPLAPQLDLRVVSPGLQRTLDAHPYPVYVINMRWDLVAWNRPAACVLGDLDAVPPEQRNIVWLMFTSPAYRRLVPDWEAAAQRMLARFRIHYGRAAKDPAFLQLVADLNAASPEFQRWWPQQDLLGASEAVKCLRMAGLGDIEFEYTAFQVEGPAELRMIAYVPMPGKSTMRMKKLVAENKPCQLYLSA